jgi:saccharopine dehydrogenase-like NADP-dependent oxidoreductase
LHKPSLLKEGNFSMNGKHTIFVAGAGGIGQAVALLLREWSAFEVDIYLGDINADAARAACEKLRQGSDKTGAVEAVTMPPAGSNAELDAALSASEVILDCLPGGQAPRLAQLALKHNLHYANLTEYVAETNQIMNIARDAQTGFVLQTGLAPGFINVLGKSLFDRFCAEYGVDKVERLALRVGALSEHAEAPHFYAFTWSTVGVATEYVKDAIVVRDYQECSAPSLSERETLIIDGVTYEADLTSGGAADLPEALAGRVRDLDYKTLRYPGHYAWVQETLKSARDADAIEYLQRTMEAYVPAVENDVVLVYASVQGFDRNGVRRALQKAYRILPLQLAGQTLRAIQTTTAAPLAECAAMLLTGQYKGVVLQSQLHAADFLNGRYVSQVYGLA